MMDQLRMTQASFLDPRFKKMYLSPMSVKDEIFEITIKSQMFTQERRISDVDKPEDLDDFMSSYNKNIDRDLRNESENNELKLYFSLPQAAWKSNPLEVWKVSMPVLYKLAMRYLVTPGSSVPSERLASAIKCVVCSKI
ncbi:uncharacterized protein LOC119559036 [Drosophila subpulchrella]|uniref:uncharacterized protein LOC119559036 n=1 Tax=Drosophila subpulchrella TaxID=1486046 RepID=UPI0018A13D34|nr:uncharacterized protein LOC119559036 [Drosophila subpulchrella]